MTSTLASAVTTGTWTIDPVHSVASFYVRHFGLTWMRGGFDSFDLTLVASESGDLSIAGSAPVDQIAFTNDQLKGHLMSPDFFDAELHPSISFESSDVNLAADGSATVSGSLTMRGQTKPITLTGTWSGPLEGMGGEQRIGLQLEGTLDRYDYGISWKAQLAGGADVVGAQVRIDGRFELVQQ
jgi:polyisoprenoid-binding protein YceI